jgi:hypothetical protein
LDSTESSLKKYFVFILLSTFFVVVLFKTIDIYRVHKYNQYLSTSFNGIVDNFYLTSNHGRIYLKIKEPNGRVFVFDEYVASTLLKEINEGDTVSKEKDDRYLYTSDNRKIPFLIVYPQK